MDITGVNNNPSVVPQAPVITPEKIQEVVEEVAPLFDADTNINVRETHRVTDADETNPMSDLPELDDADAELLAKLTNVKKDLEALIALLQAEQDEAMIKATKERIESLKGQMSAHHEATMKKVNETIDEIKEQERAALANKILGWLGVVVSIVAAVALCVTVGGAAAGVAVAGAVFGTVMAGLNEGGVIEDLINAIAESIQKDQPGWSHEACQAWAQGIVAGLQILVSIGLAVGGGFAQAGTGLIKISDAAMKGMKIGMSIANSTMQAASIVGSSVSTAANYDAAMGQAEVTETQALLQKLKKLMDEESEDLKELLAKLNDALGDLIELLESKQDTLNEINQQIGA